MRSILALLSINEPLTPRYTVELTICTDIVAAPSTRDPIIERLNVPLYTQYTIPFNAIWDPLKTTLESPTATIYASGD
ncbi:hypothetical protein D3C81_1894600 [compost metagenome]